MQLMLSKARISTITSLKAGKYRKKLGLFIAEGTTNVLDLIAGGMEAEQIIATPKWIRNHAQPVKGIGLEEADEKTLLKVSNLKTPPEVLAIFRIPQQTAPDLQTFDDLALMLDDIRDPGNLGTIIRTADWFGIRQILCSGKTVDVYNPKVVQASMGSLGRVQVHYGDLPAMLAEKPDYLKVFAAVLNGRNIDDVPKPHRGIIMIGNESRGISKALLDYVDERITIPNVPLPDGKSAESLNASIAAAIICYAFRR